MIPGGPIISQTHRPHPGTEGDKVIQTVEASNGIIFFLLLQGFTMVHKN